MLLLRSIITAAKGGHMLGIRARNAEPRVKSVRH